MTIINDKALNSLVKKGILKQDKTNKDYVYVSDNGFIKKKLISGDVFLSEPTEISVPKHVEEYSKFAVDLLSYKEVIIKIQEEIEQSIKRNSLVKANSSLTSYQVAELVKEYQNFLAGERSWKHTDEALRYKVSTSTIKRYLKLNGIYDAEKHRRKNNLPKQKENKNGF